MQSTNSSLKNQSFFSYPSIISYLSMFKHKDFIRVYIITLIAFYLIYDITEFGLKEGEDAIFLSLLGLNWMSLIYVLFISIPIFRAQNHYGLFSYKEKSYKISNWSFQIREVGLIWFLGSFILFIPIYRVLKPVYFYDYFIKFAVMFYIFLTRTII